MLLWTCATAAPAPQEKTKASLSPIHYAARDADLGKVTALLKDNPALVSTKDNDGFTALHYAALNGQYAIAKLLLANKADVNAENNHGDSPLHSAAAFGDIDVVELLLANKADVNAKNNHGDTPLESAAALGHKDVADLLRSRDAFAQAPPATPIAPSSPPAEAASGGTPTGKSFRSQVAFVGSVVSLSVKLGSGMSSDAFRGQLAGLTDDLKGIDRGARNGRYDCARENNCRAIWYRGTTPRARGERYYRSVARSQR